MKMKYNGRSLANAMNRDIEQSIERELRRVASVSGARIRKTYKGFEIEGNPKNLGRFCDKLGR